MKALKHHWMEPKTIWILCISSLFVTGKRRKKALKNEKYVHGDKKRFEFEQASKLLTIPETQIFFCYIHQCFRAFCPIHDGFPSTNSTSKGISTQKPEAKSQVSEIMAKQIIKGNVRETSTFFFNIMNDSIWDCGFSKQKWTVSAH